MRLPVLRAFSEAQVSRMLDTIYDAAVSPDGWRLALDELALIFKSHFADLFARTHDWTQFHGRAVGLDRADYDDIFLGVWCKRNVWAKAKPVRLAGEVLATWQMVDKATVLRSEIYADYLQPRALNEGLRLSLWADEDWIQDISLIRPWAAGPFDPGEIALGKFLLPHLQRAASVSRRLGRMDGLAQLEGLDRPAFLVDGVGRIIRSNAEADVLLGRAAVLFVEGGRLRAAGADHAAFAIAVAGAAGVAQRLPRATALTLAPTGPGRRLQFDILPVREPSQWSLPCLRAVLVIGARRTGPPIEEVAARFGLTPAEAEFAIQLLSGRTLGQIAEDSGRSIHTIRSHNARVLAKTDTRRQSDLVRLLSELDRRGGRDGTNGHQMIDLR